SLRAAWACDDMIPPRLSDTEAQADPVAAIAAEAAVDCRKQAIAYFLQAREHDLSFFAEAGGEDLLLAELYRRTGQFAQTEKLCQDGPAKASNETIQQLFQVQSTLASQQDTKCYTIADALNLDEE
ncbi:MAG TPA: hypothetical protein VKB76_09065, partial [Ktedonobacterales bacterium]|nr:hypothetical protein [Ktedonobacterales bacterium]